MKTLLRTFVLLIAFATGSTISNAAPEGLSYIEAYTDYTQLAIKAAAEEWEMPYSDLASEYADGLVLVRCVAEPYIYEVERLAVGGSILVDLEDSF